MPKNNFEFKWTITPEEERSREKALLWISIPIVVLLTFEFISGIIFDDDGGAKDGDIIIITIILVSISFLFVIAYSFFRRRSERNYYVNNSGIRISNEKESGSFSWEDFKFFFCIPDMANQIRPDIKERTLLQEKFTEYAEKTKNISGVVFYFKLKPKTRLEKIFKYSNTIIVYSEPDNYQKIYNSLINILEYKKNQLPGFGKLLYK